MSLRRFSTLPVLLLGAMAVVGCQASSTPTLTFSMSTAGGASTNLEPGGTVSITLSAANVSGFTSTPVAGTVALQVSPADAGTLDQSNVTLGADGTATVKFTMCTSGADCVANTAVTISGTFSGSNGKTSTSSMNLTIAGNLVLELTAPAMTSATVAPGTAITVSLKAFRRTAAADTADGGSAADAGASDGGSSASGTPVQGTVALTATNGTVGNQMVTLDANGTGSVTFTICSASASCTGTATLSGLLTVNGSSASSTLAFAIGSSSTGMGSSSDMDGGSGMTSQSSGGFLLTTTLVNADGSPSTGRVNAGAKPLTLAAVLTQGGMAVPSKKLTFAVTGQIGTLTDASDMTNAGTSIDVTTDVNGKAAVQLTPESTSAAEGDLTVTFADATTETQLTAQQVITVVVPGSLVFQPAMSDPYYPVMGVKGGGWREQNTFRFQVLDSTGQPYLGSAEIHFSVPPLGGATVSPTDIFTDQNGQAVTTVYSGVSAGTLAVTASTSIALSSTTTIPLNVTSDTVAVVGAKAFGRRFAISCDAYSLPALWGNDCTFMHVDANATCTAVIGDRYGNVLGRSEEVTWLSEAGLFGPPSSTPAAMPGVDPTTEPLLGRTSNSLRMLNAPMPQDVAPLAGEPSVMLPANSPCGARTANPRDGLVTFIAATQGEEGFTDENANGKWDPGEPFNDQGEPYVDSNDNNRWDPGEPFIDVNGNGTYDAANGKWDADTTIWAEAHVALTGSLSATWNPDPPQPGLFSVTWQDENLNEASATFSTFGFSLAAPANGTVSLNSPAILIDRIGSMSVTQPTVCSASSVGDVCNAQNPNCDCTLSTTVTFDGPRPTIGTYTPGMAPAGGPVLDTIQATVTEKVGNGTIAVQDARPVLAPLP